VDEFHQPIVRVGAAGGSAAPSWLELACAL